VALTKLTTDRRSAQQWRRQANVAVKCRFN